MQILNEVKIDRGLIMDYDIQKRLKASWYVIPNMAVPGLADFNKRVYETFQTDVAIIS